MQAIFKYVGTRPPGPMAPLIAHPATGVRAAFSTGPGPPWHQRILEAYFHPSATALTDHEFNFEPDLCGLPIRAVSAGLFVEAFYLLCFAGSSYRTNVNRRLKLLRSRPQSRRTCSSVCGAERGLTSRQTTA